MFPFFLLQKFLYIESFKNQKKRKCNYRREWYLFIRKSHNITKAICHFLTVPNVQFQFLNLHREEEREDFARSRILYFPEEGTLEAQAPYLTRILSLCYLPLCKETGGTKDTACYQIERLSRCSVGMVTRGNETPVNKNNGRGVSKVSRVSLPPFSTLTIMLVN